MPAVPVLRPQAAGTRIPAGLSQIRLTDFLTNIFEFRELTQNRIAVNVGELAGKTTTSPHSS
jgi:hypothetical protein